MLEASGPRIYGYGSDFESRQEGLLVSDDSGRSWAERAVPEPLVSLAIDPDDPDRVLAAGAAGVYASSDAARRWRPLRDGTGLLAWAASGTAYTVTPDGRVMSSADRGASWLLAGHAGGRPAAVESSGDDLYVALHDGRVMRSADGGRTWLPRSSP